MGVTVCAFIEFHREGRWQLYKTTELADKAPPQNFAPQPWGEYNFSIYYQQSGEKGLPKDLSTGLKKIIETHLNQFNDDALNRPSWMSFDDLLEFFNSDADCRYAHFDLDYLQQLQESLNADIRVVFWAE
ncbi:hypothetical protein GCM10011365_19170 [Marinicella pacifica]|uniref:Uncharacterized protein n=1 Tax=Marinicella pacifica TaxID=1171543 RepID=A0A917CTN1_9GAMM|nr:hypothetical protein [Marinicella pacifica]GGF98001.1 hypothetical protein GCM10011365_19170 [Marinicella pacifica]